MVAERPGAVVQCQISLERCEREMVRPGVVSGPPDTEGTDRSVEHPVLAAPDPVSTPTAGQRHRDRGTGGHDENQATHRGQCRPADGRGRRTMAVADEIGWRRDQGVACAWMAGDAGDGGVAMTGSGLTGAGPTHRRRSLRNGRSMMA